MDTTTTTPATFTVETEFCWIDDAAPFGRTRTRRLHADGADGANVWVTLPGGQVRVMVHVNGDVELELERDGELVFDKEFPAPR